MNLCWLKPEDIVEYPLLHSSAEEIKPLLIVLPFRKTACIGWYFGGLINDWRMEGSPSPMKPTAWMPLPPVP